MASFSNNDYRQLFLLGRALYLDRVTPKAVGTVLMAMSEAVLGQQSQWPPVHKNFRHLMTYELDSKHLPDMTESER
jgi:hypothetical protein